VFQVGSIFLLNRIFAEKAIKNVPKSVLLSALWHLAPLGKNSKPQFFGLQAGAGRSYGDSAKIFRHLFCSEDASQKLKKI
jgi:hypothetical protein